MTSTLTATLGERIDETTISRVREDIEHAGDGHPESTAPAPNAWISRLLETRVAKGLGHRHLLKLAENRGRVTAAWRELPDRMHLAANQTKLMMELVEDFRSGSYRKVPWRSIAIAAAAILYVANPADVLPDVIAWLGVLDDIAVAAFAARVLRDDLRAYCQYKGYAVEDYFPAA
jgi:uncharacterized membrane protein YkvA (DUF1232 family)